VSVSAWRPQALSNVWPADTGFAELPVVTVKAIDPLALVSPVYTAVTVAPVWVRASEPLPPATPLNEAFMEKTLDWHE
jgi:hypothetical protein